MRRSVAAAVGERTLAVTSAPWFVNAPWFGCGNGNYRKLFRPRWTARKGSRSAACTAFHGSPQIQTWIKVKVSEGDLEKSRMQWVAVPGHHKISDLQTF